MLHFITLLSEKVISPVASVAVGRGLQALCLCGWLMLAPLLFHLCQEQQFHGSMERLSQQVLKGLLDSFGAIVLNALIKTDFEASNCPSIVTSGIA